MIPGDQRSHRDLVPLQPEDLGIGDQVFGVLVMGAAADESADFVQQRRHAQQQPLPRARPWSG